MKPALHRLVPLPESISTHRQRGIDTSIPHQPFLELEVQFLIDIVNVGRILRVDDERAVETQRLLPVDVLVRGRSRCRPARW